LLLSVPFRSGGGDSHIVAGERISAPPQLFRLSFSPVLPCRTPSYSVPPLFIVSRRTAMSAGEQNTMGGEQEHTNKLNANTVGFWCCQGRSVF
jgi:hypothetical protein